MDNSVVKKLLDSQEKAFMTAFEVMKEQFQARITALETRVVDLTSSLEFTQAEVLELKEQVKTLDREKKDNLTAIEHSVNKIKELENVSNYLNDYSRRHNLRITGIEEQANETWEQTASKITAMLQTKLQLPDIPIERAHRVGPSRNDRPRPIVARFERYCDREAALRNARKLRGTGVFLNEDLCAASQAIKMSLMPQLKQARSEGKVAFFRHTKLIVKERSEQRGTATSGVTPATLHRGVPTLSTEGGGNGTQAADQDFEHARQRTEVQGTSDNAVISHACAWGIQDEGATALESEEFPQRTVKGPSSQPSKQQKAPSVTKKESLRSRAKQ